VSAKLDIKIPYGRADIERKAISISAISPCDTAESCIPVASDPDYHQTIDVIVPRLSEKGAERRHFAAKFLRSEQSLAKAAGKCIETAAMDRTWDYHDTTAIFDELPPRTIDDSMIFDRRY
jgi:hypothetical protein